MTKAEAIKWLKEEAAKTKKSSGFVYVAFKRTEIVKNNAIETWNPQVFSRVDWKADLFAGLVSMGLLVDSKLESADNKGLFEIVEPEKVKASKENAKEVEPDKNAE